MHDLRVWLTKHKMTQRRLAERLDVAQLTINRYVTGRVTPPKMFWLALETIEREVKRG